MPYADYHDFDQSYFAKRDLPPSERHPMGYDRYGEDTLEYARYAEEIDTLTPQKVLVVGCGYGFTIRYLLDLGWDRVYGMDISEWAVQHAPPELTDRIHQGDALDADRYGEIASDTRGPPRWDAIYTEYLLEHFTDDEAVEATSYMREAADTVVHRIWSGTGDPRETRWFNLKTVDEWTQLVGDGHTFIDYDDPEASTFGP